MERKKTWAIDLLKAEIHDVDKPFATRLFNHLRWQKDKLTIDLLASAARNNKFTYIRAQAIIALGNIKAKGTLKLLTSLLESDSEAVQIAAARALKEITGENFGPDQSKWQEWWLKNKNK